MTPSPTLPASLALRYQLRRVLGRGGFGSVVEAEDTSSGRMVAIKLLDRLSPVELERFQREARLLSRVRHPGVVQVLDFGLATEGEPYLVMELVPGGELPRQGWSVEGVVDLVEQVAAALDELHRLGLVHRDLKPGNLLRRDDGSVVLADFGLARTIQAGSTVTQEGIVVGTPAYMAPELWAEATATPASDQFALAALACRLLSGAGVYPDGDPIDIGKAALGAGARVPVGVPRRLRPCLARAVGKDPVARHASCGALAEALRVGAEAEPLTASTPGALTRSLVPASLPQAPSGDTTGRRLRPPRARVLPRVLAILAVATLVGFLSVGPGASPTAPDASSAPPVASAPPAPPTPPAPDLTAYEETIRRETARIAGYVQAPGTDPIYNLAGRFYREAVAREPGFAEAWRGLVQAQGAWLREAGPEPLMPPGYREARWILRNTADARKLLRAPLRLRFAFGAEATRDLGPRLEAMVRDAESALAPTLGRPQPPARVVQVGGLLLLSGYPDPHALLDRVREAAAADPVGNGMKDGFTALTVALSEVASLDDLPCDLRREWVHWLLVAMADPRHAKLFPRTYHWGWALTHLLDACVILEGDDCAGEDPAIIPAIEALIPVVQRRWAADLKKDAPNLEHLQERTLDQVDRAQMTPSILPVIRRLAATMGGEVDPARLPPWRRDLEGEGDP